MPNIPSSTAHTPAKKRKLSSISSSSAVPTNRASIDVCLHIQPNPSGSNEQLCNNLEAIMHRSRGQMNNEQAGLDDAILNSEVYQIYCRYKDPKEAMKEMMKLKSLSEIVLSKKPFPAEKDFQNACEVALDRLWKLEPCLADSKFEKIKKFINGDITESQLAKSDDKVNITTLIECLSWIKILLPKGYEHFYVANFELGPGKSKWYRAESSKPNQDVSLAMLNVLGINNSIISKLHYDHYLAKNSTNVEWLDFAKELILWDEPRLFDAPKGCKKGMLSQ